MLLDDEQTVAALIIKAEVQGGLVLEDIYELVPDLDENFDVGCVCAEKMSPGPG